MNIILTTIYFFFRFHLIQLNLHLVHFDERKSKLSVDKSSIFNSLIRIKLTVLNVSSCTEFRLCFKLSLFL